MPDPTPGQAPDPSGQAPQTSQQQPQSQQPNDGQEPEDEAFDKDRALATIRKLRETEKQAKQHAKEVETLRQQLKQHEDAKLSESERLSKRLAELERKEADWQRERQELTLRSAVERGAAKLGIVDPDAAYRLLDLTSLDFEEDGSPKALDKALEALLKQRPYLAGARTFGGASINAGAGQTGGSAASNSMNDLIRRAAGRA